jgi:hypothetical protein
MSKKLIAACMAIAAFSAFAMSSTASAAPVLTHPTGTVFCPAGGCLVLGTNVGETVMTTSLGNVTCNKATLTGKVTSNSTAGGSKGEVTSATFINSGSTECSSWTGGVTVNANPTTNGLPWCLEATTATDVAKVRGGSCAGEPRAIRFVLAFTSSFIGTCTYQRSPAAEGTVQTDLEPGKDATASLVAQEWTKLEGGAGCPSSGKLDMTFTLETDTVTPEPLYFSS